MRKLLPFMMMSLGMIGLCSSSRASSVLPAKKVLLSKERVAAPSNDECTGALEIPVTAGMTCASSVSGTLVDATQSPVAQTCYFSIDASFDNDVWFYFEALATRHLVALSNVLGSTNDLIFEAFSGTCGSLSQLECHDDPNDQFILSGLSIGQTYYLRVASFDSEPQTTMFDLCVKSAPAAPANDECSFATPITISTPSCEATINATIVGATGSANPESCDFGVPFFNDVWFTFSATETMHELTISNIQQEPEELFFQFSSGACGSLSELMCINSLDGSGPYSLTDLTIGVDYFLRIATYDTETKNTTFDLCVKGSAMSCPLLVTSIANEGPGTLRDMISCAEANDTIRFDPSLNGLTIELDLPTILLDKKLVLFSNQSNNITLSNVNASSTQSLISLQNNLSIIGLKIVGKTESSMIFMLESGGSIELLDSEVEKLLIDKF